jgi:hypothetical protein
MTLDVPKWAGRWRRLRVIATVSVIGLLAGLLCMRLGASSFYEDYAELRAKIRVGMSEADLVRSIGKPSQVQRPGTNQKTCRVPGWSSTERAISDRCLVYFGKGDSIAYVYIDRFGVVEGVYVGGS